MFIQAGAESLFCISRYKKAFDSVNHKILLEKLSCYGFRGKALDLLTSYLSDRFQYVITPHRISSTMKHITCGVPQGSVLGPLLFNLFMNDLSHSISLDCILCADDTCIVASTPDLVSLSDIANAGVSEIVTWMVSNRLILKTQVVLFSDKVDKNFSILMQGCSIPCSPSAIYLRVTIDCDFK